MLNRLYFKGQVDAYSLTLGYRIPNDEFPRGQTQAGAVSHDSTSVSWDGKQSDTIVVQKVVAAASDVTTERVVVQFGVQGIQGFFGVINAASYQNEVQVRLHIESTKAPIRFIDLLRTGGGGNISTALGLALWSAVDVSNVTRLTCNDGAASLWDRSVLGRFSSLSALNLSYAGLSTLPGIIGSLISLRELRLVGNHLKILPHEIGKLNKLQILAVDSNELAILPGELKHCVELREFTLENNKLTSILINFGSLSHLHTLKLFGNPLEYLPEISSCRELRTLSVANLRVRADQKYLTFHVELLAPSGPASSITLFDSKPTDKLRPIFSLMLRRSSGHHPLLAGALRHLAEEDVRNRDLMAKQENAMQQLILMALNDDPVVVTQTCRTLELLAEHSQTLAESIMETESGFLMILMNSSDAEKQMAGLSVIAALARVLANPPKKLLTHALLKVLIDFAENPNADLNLRVAALTALGNLGFSSYGKATLAANRSVVQIVSQLAGIVGNKGITPPIRVKSAAVRVLAILGDIESVDRALGRPVVRGKGVRVLAMDGGGMKGLASVRLLGELERRCGKPIHKLFDLIVGTSTGGLLAVALGLRKFTLEECEDIYKVLGQRVFSKPETNREKEESWTNSIYRAFESRTQHVRAFVVGYKHDASVYEGLLKEYCRLSDDLRCLSEGLIDSAALDVPKVALVATLASANPAIPFVFRNYELEPSMEDQRQRMCFQQGSSKHPIWQAVRASSAAIYYLDDFTSGDDKFQDGAVVANNPGVIALQEAKALWPHANVSVLVSIGTGSTPPSKRSKGLSSFMETGNIIIESATSVDRVHEALATMNQLMPDMKYFRFNPMDARCGMELDEIDPLKWEQLEAATDDFVANNASTFEAAAAALSENMPFEKMNHVAYHSSEVPMISGRKEILVVTSGHLYESTVAELAARSFAPRIHSSSVLDLQALETPSNTAARESVSLSTLRTMRTSPQSKGEKASAKGVTPTLSTPASPSVGTSALVNGTKTDSLSPTVIEFDVGSALDSMMNWFSPSKSRKDEAGGLQRQLPESVSSPPLQLPKIDVKIPKGNTSGSKRVVERVQGAISAIDYPSKLNDAIIDSGDVGVVHFALRSCSRGLVLKWAESFATVVVPSQEADELVLRCGMDPETVNVSDLFEKTNGELILDDGTVLRAVSKQYRRSSTGEALVVLSIERMNPVSILDQETLSTIRYGVSRRLFVSSEALPVGWHAAAISAGALGVVSPAVPLQNLHNNVFNAATMSSFWTTFYSALHKRGNVTHALEAAEELFPKLKGVFQLHC